MNSLPEEENQHLIIKTIKVVVAIIQDENQKILVTKRAENGPHPGLWEFPGDKVESGEDPEKALYRELQEELGISVQSASFLKEIQHDYSDNTVHLLVYRIHAYTGQPRCLENQQDLRMLSPVELTQLDFPEANTPLVDMLLESVGKVLT